MEGGTCDRVDGSVSRGGDGGGAATSLPSCGPFVAAFSGGMSTPRRDASTVTLIDSIGPVPTWEPGAWEMPPWQLTMSRRASASMGGSGPVVSDTNGNDLTLLETIIRDYSVLRDSTSRQPYLPVTARIPALMAVAPTTRGLRTDSDRSSDLWRATLSDGRLAISCLGDPYSSLPASVVSVREQEQREKWSAHDR